MNNGIIYIAKNKINGKSYIGQTTKTLKKRIKKHYEKNKNNNHFARALRKYKKEDWEWKILYDNISEEYLNIAEICAIYVYDTFYIGYNSTLGGEDNPMNYIENRKKVSQSQIGIKNHRYGKAPWNKGTKQPALSKEHKEKLKAAHKDNSGSNNPMYGKVPHNKGKMDISKWLNVSCIKCGNNFNKRKIYNSKNNYCSKECFRSRYIK